MEGIKRLIGRRVVAKSGKTVGNVKDVLMQDYAVQGILAGGLFIDKQYILNTQQSIMLSIEPVTFLLGKLVYDADGKKLGKVVGIVRSGANDYTELEVKKNIISKPINIPKQDIETTKENILLKTVW